MNVSELIEKLKLLKQDKEISLYYDSLCGSFDLHDYMIVETTTEVMFICAQDDEIDELLNFEGILKI